MFRVLHRYAGLIGALVLISIALTGAILAVFPALEADSRATTLDAGHLVSAVSANVPGAEQITVDDNGRMVAVRFGANGFEQIRVDGATGEALGPVETNATELWFEDLHRSLFMGDTGHWIVIGATAAMILLCVSGYVLAARRMGGWSQLFARDRSGGAGGWHLKIARIAGFGIILSSLTGLWMAAATMGWVPETAPNPAYPTNVSTGTAADPATLTELTAIDGSTIRAITLPRTDVPGMAYMVETDAGAGYIDPVTGEMLSWDARDGWSKAMDVIHLLHTGQGMAWVGLVLGLASLMVPVLSGTGVLVWLAGRITGTRKFSPAPKAEVIVLVGSEGGTTWRFANAFGAAMQDAGKTVHVAAMSAFAPNRYTQARQIVAFAATYGEGDAPSGADGFIDRLNTAKPLTAPLSVLGFGDSSYPTYCAYGDLVRDTSAAKGWTIGPKGNVNRQSERDFTDWAVAFGQSIGVDLSAVATYLEDRPTTALTLQSARMYGEDAQAPTAILRFALPRVSLLDRLLGRGFAGLRAGDLLNIIPEGSKSPRAYSLASGTRDGFLEICVRKQPGGLCSTQLCTLTVGETVTAYATRNASFHPVRDTAPLLLVGAGAGIGALAGFARENTAKRPLHLYFGIRSNQGGYPYDQEFADWQQDGHMTASTLAVSRGTPARYVQDALEADADRVAQLITSGARIMVCGGRDMAAGVRKALDHILESHGLAVDLLKSEGRYVEDVF
ncbi:PepSY domain-containing protein [Donghicola mangrovi]|uniref:NADPH--hemoprotein reductase n=1 Tax=Donghicola mangrovi TaxID=2729614 RepID=A0A850QC12_9RHOB|nr:PepSY domain-containing protein [Donghicola mangrovi]NVO23965.1 N-acetylglucosamine transferase [Donghicola mangrovi]